MEEVNYFKLLGGIVAVITGTYVLVQFIMNPNDMDDVTNNTFKGYTFSILAIIFGLLLIFKSCEG